MNFDQKLEKIIARHGELEAQLAQGGLSSEEFVSVSKELAELNDVVEVARGLLAQKRALQDMEEMVAQPTTEPDLKALAQEEIPTIKTTIAMLEKDIQILLLPKDQADEKNAILEVRAGTGGSEAALFAGVLLRMYQRYAELQGWKVELLDLSETDLKGVKEAAISITGKNVFARLKFESGVHRVQRVPETETQGRVHTSAATIAVLPEAEEVDIHIEDKDLRIDVFRSSGPGGQSVNTTDSAVRITHIPTGLVVQQQDEKSQHKNKAKALKILRSRLYEVEREKLQQERSSDRKNQIGSGDRSERIRTYNFPQGRVTDHRINLTLYKIDQVVSGEALGEIIDALITSHQAQQLANLE